MSNAIERVAEAAWRERVRTVGPRVDDEFIEFLAGFKAARAAEQREPEPRGGANCPICGRDWPHAHDEQYVQNWVNNQLSRWGYAAIVHQVVTTDDRALTAKLAGAIKWVEGRRAGWERGYGWQETGADDAIALLRIFSGFIGQDHPRVRLANGEPTEAAERARRTKT